MTLNQSPLNVKRPLNSLESFKELPLVFDCQGELLIGILHQASEIKLKVGVLIVVGGPQFRAGSHRQFVLLARHLADNGVPVMRFDVRGMGDSSGAPRQFHQLNDDIKAAIDNFLKECPHLHQVVILGLCDAASAALFYAYQDDRVAGLVLLNPWIFTKQGAAKTYLKYYYWQRLTSQSFWRKLFAFKFDYMESIKSLRSFIKQAKNSASNESSEIASDIIDMELPLPIRMSESLRQFTKPVLFILSGQDLTAKEFIDVTNNDAEWQLLINSPRVNKYYFPEADHTFSTAVWRNQVADWTLNWINDQCD
jgi:exosortase A-associated hydrolase 1